MKGFVKFLAFYSLIIATVIMAGSAFFLPHPQGYFISAALLPITVYFWISATNPSAVSANKWSFRLIFSVTVIGVLGIFSYWLSSFTATPQKQNDQEQIAQLLDELERSNKQEYQKIIEQLELLSNEIESNSSGKENENVLSFSNEVAQPDLVSLVEQNYLDKKGEVTISSSVWNSIDVFSEPSSSSDILGSISYGDNFPYFKKESDWYLVELPDDTQGYVRAEFVKEIE